MVDIIKSKEIIITETNKILDNYTDNNTKHIEIVNGLYNEINNLNEYNKKLVQEISLKDKAIHTNELKMKDYESMINTIQDEAMKEITEKERFDMLKKQDKEIYDRNIEIKVLQKKIITLKKSNKDKCVSNEMLVQSWVNGREGKNIPYLNWGISEPLPNDIYYHPDDEKIKIAIESYSKHLKKEVSLDELNSTSAGICGWYLEGIRKNKGSYGIHNPITINKDTEDNSINSSEKKDVDSQEEEGEINVIDTLNTDSETGEKDPNLIYIDDVKVETEVINASEEEVETEVIDASEEKDNNEDTEDISEEEDDEMLVDIITHYKKEYYIIIGEEPQYIYVIDDGELGEKVGEMVKGKKHFYKSSKK